MSTSNVDANKLYDITLHYKDGEEETYWEMSKDEIEHFMNSGFHPNLERYSWKPSENQPHIDTNKPTR